MLKRLCVCALAALVALLFVPGLVSAAGLTVLTVPEDPTNLTTPHTTYPTATIIMGATCPSCVGSTDSFTVDWSFGDGTPDATFALTNPYDISTTHAYSPGSTPQSYTATVTVTDTTTPNSGSAQYLVIVEPNTLASRVDIAIDWGLWYMHQTMWRQNSPANGQTVNWGGWDQQTVACPTVGGAAYDCTYPGVINADNVQAFEVSGHTAGEANAAIDPYADDVARGIARMLIFLGTEANNTDTYNYNPATSNYSCNIGGTTYDPYYYYSPSAYPYCGTGSQVFYEPGATSCTSPPCAFTPDGNANGQMTYSSDGSGEPIYTTGPFIDALVASNTPTATAPTGAAATVGPPALPGVIGQTYQNIVQDMSDWYASCQFGDDYDVGNSSFSYGGYDRGGGYSGSGGGWLYLCNEGDDNSTSQWAAIGLIAGYRGLGIAVPQQVKDFNSVWVTNSETGLYYGYGAPWAYPTGTDPWASDDLGGSFGYRGDLADSDAWGGFATTPSGMVQMALDGIGRTTNTAFGDASTAADQRFNNAETYYADNFCNNTASGAYNAPRAYTYGMFSFTKAMLLHDPGGSLSAIQFLRTQTTGVFTGDASDPTNTIDWYAALSPANGGTDACDGIAQTLVSYQSPDGHWYGNDYDTGYQAGQSPFETAWSIIMLRKTVFVSCISAPVGRGTPGHGVLAPLIDLTWGVQPGATSYSVLRGTTNGGPYTQIGTTAATAYADRTGLVNGDTYYYVVEPLNSAGAEICESNQEPITIP